MTPEEIYAMLDADRERYATAAATCRRSSDHAADKTANALEAVVFAIDVVREGLDHGWISPLAR